MTTNLSNLYQIDESLENEGVLVEISQDIKIKVAAMGNKEYLKIKEKVFKPYRGAKKRNNLDQNVEEDLYNQIMAKTVLIGWEGIKDEEGKEVPYSYEKAYEILSDPTMKHFKATVLEIALEAETFRSQDKDDDAKN